ncbi:MAG: hypothetical protein DCF25_07300 [Leptolyngbya foveolarum]|uniref:Uncharacterized protein n=1 Tax=Leptolyngbya foveolarum TaxID=47253 RepID=A0A2W4WLB9_9CYAN|nr:MAG: hypothetical protein DCF25_07300 [Leptolyngbya foveolarum]
MTIRVWLIGFVLLFVSVELLDWVLQMGSSQPVGYWTVLGGLGLAAASNAKRLPKLSGSETKSDLTDASGKSVSQPKASPLAPEQSNAKTVNKSSKQAVDRSDDSISFRVRLPWR